MISLLLPWPSDKALSPNARVHWAEKARAKKAMRHSWALLAKSQGLKAAATENLELHLVFMQKDRRPRDLDNLLASCKAGLDGLADVLAVDDSKWAVRMEKDLAPKGTVEHVVVTIKEL